MNKTMYIDFVAMNKDFQQFVASVLSTASIGKVGPCEVTELLQMPTNGGTGTLQDSLADIISSIRLIL